MSIFTSDSSQYLPIPICQNTVKFSLNHSISNDSLNPLRATTLSPDSYLPPRYISQLGIPFGR